MSTRWQKIQRKTKCSEGVARSASLIMRQLGEFKGAILTYPPPVQEYLLDKLGECFEDILENPSDIERGNINGKS